MARDLGPEERGIRRSPDLPGSAADRAREVHTIPPAERIVERLPSERERETSPPFTPDFSRAGRRAVLYDGDRAYRLTTREIRIIIDVGKFRAVDENDLAKQIPAEDGEKRLNGTETLIRQGLACRKRFEGPEGSPRYLLTLTRRGRRLLRAH